jgi:sugar lactone lactonase YvrE
MTGVERLRMKLMTVAQNVNARKWFVRLLTLVALLISITSVPALAQKFSPYKMWGSPASGSGSYTTIHDIDIAPDGTVWIVDVVGCKVVHWDKDGNFLGEFGVPGSGPGQFSNPIGLAVDPQGNIVVADAGNNRIQVLKPDGTFIRSFGEQVLSGTANMPVAVALDGTIFVADPGHQQVVRFSSTGVFEASWQNGFNYFGGIATDAFGHVYVSDFYNDRIQKFKFDGTHVKNITGQRSAGLHVDFAGHLVVADLTRNAITRMSLDGEIYSVHSPTLANGGFNGLWGITTDEAGRVYTADLYDLLGRTIKVFQPIYPKYRQKTTFAVPGGFLRGTLIDRDGNLLICIANDYNPGSIKKYRTDGTFLGEFATGLVDPQCIQNGQNGDVAIIEYRNGLIKLVDSSGLLKWSDFPGPNSYPGLLQNVCVVRPDGVIVVCSNDMTFTEYLPDGTRIRQVQVSLPINGPWGLAVDGRGRYWISDFYTSQLELLSSTYQHLKTVNLSQTAHRTLMSRTGVLIVPGTNILSVVSINGELLGEVTNSNSGTTFSGTNSLEGLNGLVGVAEDSLGNLYISDSSGGRIHVLEPWYPDDIVAPVSTVTASPLPNVFGWNNTSVISSITSTDTSGVKEIHYAITQGTEIVVTGSSASFTLTENGTHSIAYWAVDNAGNVETTKYASVRIDKVAPVTTLTRADGQLTLSAIDAHSGISKIKVQVNGGSVVDYSGAFADTVHTVTYWAEDVAGNVEASRTDIVNPGVKAISASQVRLPGGFGVIGTLTLDKVAPVGGTVINLAASAPGVVVDATVTVPEGATTATFDIDANPVAVDTSVSVTASKYETSQSLLLTIQAPTPSSLSYLSSPISGGTSTTGTITISGPAPVGGTVVSLASSSLSALVPTSVTIPAGQMTAIFTVSTNLVSNDTSAVISATVYGVKVKSTLSILGPKITAVTVASANVASTATTTGTVTLSTNASVGGKVVALSSSNTGVATVPVSVTVPAGSRTATFTITAGTVAANTAVTITASTNGSSGTATVTVTPPVAALSTITTNVAAATGGVAVTGTVTLTRAAPTGGAVVTLASSSTTVGTVPASVTVPAGATSVTFTITTRTVTAASTLTVTGTYLGVAKAASITVNPVRLVSTLTLNPTSVKGGTNSTGTVTLTGPATEAVVVTLTSGTTTVATVPTSVTVPAGVTTVTFPISTKTQTSSRTSIITSRTGTTSRTATLTVTR